MYKEVVRLESVSKVVDFELVFNNLSFSIKKSEAFAIYSASYPEAMLLIDLLCGSEIPDKGRIYVNENIFSNLHHPLRNSLSLIQVIHKDSRMHENLTVAENILLGHEQRFFVDKKTSNAQVRECLDDAFLFDIDGSTSTASLNTKQKYLLEVARIFSMQPSLVILDGIDMFSPSEINKYFTEIFKKLKLRGTSIMFYSDDIDVIASLSDRAGVFSQGTCVSVMEHGHFPTSFLKEKLYPNIATQIDSDKPNCLFEAKHLYGPKYVRDLSFKIYAGEILGLFSQVEDTYNELFTMLYAVVQPKSGQMIMEGKAIHLKSPADAMKHKISYCMPFETQHYFSNLTLKDNVLLSSFAQLSKLGLRNRRTENYYYSKLSAGTFSEQYDKNSDIASISTTAINKSYFARAVSIQPKLLLLTNPYLKFLNETEYDILEAVNVLSKNNISVIIASNKLQKLKSTCHRVISISLNNDKEPL